MFTFLGFGATLTALSDEALWRSFAYKPGNKICLYSSCACVQVCARACCLDDGRVAVSGGG